MGWVEWMSGKQLMMFILMFLSVAAPVGIILYARLVRPLQLCLKWRVIWGAVIAVLMGICVSGIPLSVYFSRNLELAQRFHFDAWGSLAYYVMAFVCVLLVCVIVRDAILGCIKLYRYIRERRHTHAERDEASGKKASGKETSGKETSGEDASSEDAPEDVSRRKFMARGTQLATVGASLLVTPVTVCSAKQRVVKYVDIALPKIPASIDGFRIAHLSDIHVGNTIYRRDIAKMVEETNALNPDLIVITGDLVEGYSFLIGSWLEPIKNLKAPYGVYFVTGNHDHLYDINGWFEIIRSMNIHILNNAHEIIDINGTKIVLAGVIDAHGDRFRRIQPYRSDPVQALDGVAPDRFKIMLAHQPSSVVPSFEAGADLVLLGHTHGGQFWPCSLLIDKIHHYAHGLYDEGSRAAFVSCGTGYWGPPLRFGVPAEIDILTLHHRDNDAS